MNLKIGSGHSKNGKMVHKVFFDDRCFENVENIPSCTPDKCRKCKYYSDCWYNGGVVRTFDCNKKAKRITSLYTFITSILVIMYFWNIFFVRHLGFFRGMGTLILGLVALDIVCTLIESIVPKIRNKHFFNKLVKQEQESKEKAQKEKELAEVKRVEDEKRKMEQFPYFKEILHAENLVKNLKDVSDEFDFGPNEDAVTACVNKLDEIITALKDEPACYSNVAFLFEGRLFEEFYKTLKFYSSFLKAGISEKKDEEILGSCIEKFMKHLNSNDVDTVLDEDSARLQFRNATQAISETLDRMADAKGEN